MASTNYCKMFNIKPSDEEDGVLSCDSKQDEDELVLYEGGDMFSFDSKVIGIISPRKKGVDLF